MGTPQVRWREMHQSGRLRDHAVDAGLAPVRHPAHLADLGRAPLRSPAWSMLMNHCGVARKMIGVLCRQQCG
jgi:hypothetical protein